MAWSPGDSEQETVIEIDREADDARQPWLSVDSFDELMAHEQEILSRIADTPKGGNLFMAHPLLLLRDIGVELSDRAREQIICREPHLTGLSPQPYLAVKRSRQQQRIRFHLQGLFRKEATDESDRGL